MQWFSLLYDIFAVLYFFWKKRLLEFSYWLLARTPLYQVFFIILWLVINCSITMMNITSEMQRHHPKNHLWFENSLSDPLL